jgi:WD40 repeat protein
VVDLPTGNVRFQTSFIVHEPEHGADFSISTRTSLEFAPDSQSFAFVRYTFRHVKLANGRYDFCSARPNAIVWLDAHSGQVRREIEVPEAGIGKLGFSPDGQIIAASTSSGRGSAVIRLFRLRDKKEIQTIDTQSGVATLTFTPSGTQLVAGLTTPRSSFGTSTRSGDSPYAVAADANPPGVAGRIDRCAQSRARCFCVVRLTRFRDFVRSFCFTPDPLVRPLGNGLTWP